MACKITKKITHGQLLDVYCRLTDQSWMLVVPEWDVRSIDGKDFYIVKDGARNNTGGKQDSVLFVTKKFAKFLKDEHDNIYLVAKIDESWKSYQSNPDRIKYLKHMLQAGKWYELDDFQKEHPDLRRVHKNSSYFQSERDKIYANYGI